LSRLPDDVTIVIPVSDHELAWRMLLDDLRGLLPGSEIVVAAASASSHIPHDRWRSDASNDVRWIRSPAGRARQLNQGAAQATRRFVWFLHADSRVTPEAVAALAESIRRSPDALHYSRLGFLDDGPRLVRLNEWGARFRSEWLKIPFGDQGFCVARAVFERLGGFDEMASFGEDHLFVWAARRAGVPLRCVPVVLRTSARKYRERGWLRTTLSHVALTLVQAVPQFTALVRSRLWTKRDRAPSPSS
jgi:GT2 family glycosyltransferase